MKNRKLYQESDEQPISVDMKRKRWQAFGHMLRLEENAPCQQAMKFYFTQPMEAKRYSGRKRSTLPVILDQDIKLISKRYPITVVTSLESMYDLAQMKEIADDRERWRSLVELLCNDVEDDECQ